MSTNPQVMQALLKLSSGATGGAAQGNLGGISMPSAPGLQPISAGLGAGANGLGIYSGLQQGGVGGDASAAVNAAQLANKAGVLPSSSALNSGIGDAGNLLGIYNGIQQGGVGGDVGAAVNAAKLGSSLGAFGSASGAVGQAAGYVAAPLDLYNEVKNWQSGATGSDALSGAETGAAVGSIIPGVGTLIGGLVGGAAGAISSAFGPGKVDPENQNFNQYTQAYNGAAGNSQQQAQIAGSLQNPYLPLAGYFDLRSGQMKGSNPIYSTYGRMGEGAFTNDLISKVQAAQASGTIKQGESATDAYNAVVQPWISSMGTWNDSNKDAMTALIQNMTGQIMDGQYQQDFKAIGGDSPFASAAQPTPSPSTPTTQQGQTQRKAMSGVMSHIRPSFVQAAQHYDEGGSAYVDYSGDLPEITVNSGGGVDPISSFQPIDLTTDPSSLTNPYGSDPLSGTGLTGTNTGMSLPSSSGGLSSAAGIGGLAGAGLGLLSALTGGGSGSGSSSFSFNPPAPFAGSGPPAAGTNPYGNFSATPRTQTNPNINYATAAQTGGVPQFYTPSPQQLSPLQNSVAGSGSASSGTPGTTGSLAALLQALGLSSGTGSASSQVPTASSQVPYMGNLGSPLLRANGGPVGDTPGVSPLVMALGGGGGPHVKGAGDGTSDDIPAMLSEGEYVIPAHVVSALGNGSNDAGAKALDALQQRVRMHVGKQMMAGKHPGRIGSPEKFMKVAA